MSANEGSPPLGAATRLLLDGAAQPLSGELPHLALVGRDAEIEALRDAVRSAMTGRGGGCLVLRGDHGSGRSRLLETALENLDSRAPKEKDGGPARVVRVPGVAAEAQLPGAGLHRLLHALGLRLPEPFERGAERRPGRPGDRLALGVAVLDLLARAGADQPLIVLVDDADQMDRLSLELLAFLGRRLTGAPVLLLFATAHPATPALDPLAGLRTVSLPPLDDAACRELLLGRLSDRDPSEIPDDVIVVLSDQGQGNPLALVELAGALTGGQLNGTEPLPTALPSGSRLRGHHRDQLSGISAAARQVLLIAAAQHPLDLDTLVRATVRAGLDPAVVDRVAASGRLRIDADLVQIPDRLLRASIYQDAGVVERLATHRLLAEVLDHDAHRLDRGWHWAMSLAGDSVPAGPETTERLARELHALGSEAARAGDQAGASRCLERSAALTSTPGQAAQHLVGAGRAAWHGGDVRRARLLLGRARLLARTAELRTVVDLLLGEIELRSGTAERAHGALTVVADGLSGPRRSQAVIALLRASEVYMLAGDHARFLSVARRIGNLARPDEEPQTRLMFEQFAGFSALFIGEHHRAAGPLRAVVEHGPLSRDPSALILATMAAMSLGDEHGSHTLATRAVAEARALPASAHLPVALEFLAFSEFWGDHYAAASAHAQEGLDLAARAGQENCVAALLAIQALLSTLHGDNDTALLRAQVAARQADGRGLCRPQSLTIWAAVRMALASGRPDGAVAALRAATAVPGHPKSGGMHLTIKVMATPDLVEAAVKFGDPQWVPAALDTFESWATEMDSRAMLALVARCHALFSPDEDAADERFREALRLHDGGDLEFERARTQLLFGRALRRRRRPAKAREHLQEALEVFDGLDARGWAGQARAELRAAGGVSGLSVPGAGELTPQQSEIARLVAGGATNREIAAQLFLSPRTVDHHLRNIFVRLGVRSRVELTRLVS